MARQYLLTVSGRCVRTKLMVLIHRSPRPECLAQELGEVLAEPLADTFASDVVGVPTKGMERWLAQTLSAQLGASPGRADGVCANVKFPPVAGLIAEAVAVASGIAPTEDPWVPGRAAWPLLEVVDGCLSEPWMAVLAAHLSEEDGGLEEPHRRTRRLSVVRHLAGIFDRYGRYRPEMVRGWADGEVGAHWQAQLWQRLRQHLDVPSPAERLVDACGQLREKPDLLDLPPRLSLFGLTRIPRGQLEVLRALAQHRDLHLFLLHPSPALWDRIAAVTDGCPAVPRRREDPTSILPANRLLASWGQDARELQLTVSVLNRSTIDMTPPAPGDGESPATLLELVQRGVRTDVSPPGSPLPGAAEERPPLDTCDRSIQIHACHGRGRQVEVVREAILHELAADPTLEPRDVIVMCPDIETFAPLIQATFGAAHVALNEEGDRDAAALDGRPDLRVRLADRSLRQTNPVLGVAAHLLDLARSRVTASQVLDLADRAPVRRRFRFDDDDLTRLKDWVVTSGIRWGLDSEHRAPWKLDAVVNGTWRAGLDRILLGVTLAEEGRKLFAGVLPLDDVESGAIDLAGRFGEFVDRLQATLDSLNGTRNLRSWAAALADGTDALTATAPQDAWQRGELSLLLANVVADTSAAADPESIGLTLPEVRSLLADRLQGRPTRANFRTGHLTVCTLVPMRSVPHRVVCLLGLDDGHFPRKAPRDGDDLLLDDPYVGDPDARSEDRQLLLDALMAASDRLIITYTGNDERTNTVRPPAVPVGELLDVVDQTVRIDGGAPRDRVLTRHPLQPFDPRNFVPGELLPERSWSFDRDSANGARALVGPRSTRPPFLASPLPPDDRPVLALEELVQFVGAPVRSFLRHRLGMSIGQPEEEVTDRLPVELDGLEIWGVGEGLLNARLSGIDLRTAAEAEMARGALPPGNLGTLVLEAVTPVVELIASCAEGQVDEETEFVSVDINQILPDGRRLTGAVPGVCGDLLRTVSYSRVAPRHRLAAWVHWLALTATHPARPWHAATLGRVRQGVDGRVTIARLPALNDLAPAERRHFALERLVTVADLHARGMREPLPLASVTSAAYAEAAQVGGNVVHAASRAWESGWGFDKEDRAPEHLVAFGRALSTEELLESLPRDDESGDGWDDDDPTRFGRYARRLWHSLLDHERVEDR